MWGRLSSGAGAAFSAVQDAYGTTTTTTMRPRSSSTVAGELQDWGSASTPSAAFSRFDPPRVAQAVRPSTFSSANPWAAPAPASSSRDGLPEVLPPPPQVLVDNPWNTTRMPRRGDPFVADELTATAPLRRADRDDVDGDPGDPLALSSTVSPANAVSETSVSASAEEMDPLGVGMW